MYCGPSNVLNPIVVPPSTSARHLTWACQALLYQFLRYQTASSPSNPITASRGDFPATTYSEQGPSLAEDKAGSHQWSLNHRNAGLGIIPSHHRPVFERPT